MTNTELTFNKIKKLLYKHFTGKVSEFEDGHYLILDSENKNDSSVWISIDKQGELTVGLGISHLHYHPKFDDLNKGFDQFLLFLTCKKRRTDRTKGNTVIRTDFEFQNENGLWKNFGTVSTWTYQFWKKTTKETTMQDGFISYEKIKPDLVEIKNTMHNNV